MATGIRDYESDKDLVNLMDKQQMGFWEHLDELRSRAVRCAWFFFIGFGICYYFSNQLLDLLRQPLFSQLPESHRKLYYTGLFENFLVHLKIAAFGSLVVFSPVYFYILWGFVAPGLTLDERKSIKPYVLVSALLFAIGAAFAYFVLLPPGIKYFLSYGSEAEVALLTLDSYVSLVLKLMAGFGVCFQIPVVIVLLAAIGILSAEDLRKNRRIAVMAIAVISALAAPPDAFSMILLMIPLYLLYELSVLVVGKRFN